MLAREWEDYFLKALLAHLTPAEQDELTRLSIFRTRLDDEAFDYAAAPPTTRQKWLDLSLLQLEQTTSAASSHPEHARRHTTYTIHPVVREYLLGRLSPDEQRALHRWAADFQGQPFVAMARNVAAQAGQSWTDEEITKLARADQGVVGQWVRRTDDLAQARAAMARALEWQHHLFSAGEYDAAGGLVTAVYAILARWGERDRAKALLRGSIDTSAGGNKAVAQGNLANLLQDEGKLVEALAIHEELYRTFETLDAKQQMAAALSQQSSVLWKMGRLDEAIAKQEASLQINQERGDEEGQAISLHQLSMLHRLAEDSSTALARSQEAEKLNRKLNREVGLASNLHEQGLIHTLLARAAAGAEAAGHRRTAVERFSESLAIERRTGNEAGAADTQAALGLLLRDAGQITEAIAAFSEYIDTQQRMNNPAKLGMGLEWLGSVHERQGHLAAALEKYRQALTILEQVGAVREAENNRRHIARVTKRMKGEG